MLFRHLRTRRTERARHPIRVREPARGDRTDFPFDIAFAPPRTVGVPLSISKYEARGSQSKDWPALPVLITVNSPTSRTNGW